MKKLSIVSSLLMILLLSGMSVQAQVWKNGEKKQAVNREADVKKRLINHESLLKSTRDTELQEIYKERVEIFKSIQTDIVEWNKRIENNDQLNSQRYNLLTSLKLRKAEEMQMLITIRSMEIAYQAFGGEYRDEANRILEDLRNKLESSKGNFDNAINQIEANIQ